MKNRYLVYFILAGLFMGSFFGAVLHNTVSASIGDITLEDWNDYNDGVTSGTGDYINWERSGGLFEIDNIETIVSDKYLSLEDGASGFINLTSDFPYINRISLYAKINIAQSGFQNEHITFSFYSSNYTNVLTLRIRGVDSPNNEELQYRDSTGNWHTLLTESQVDDNHNYIINVTHVSGNIMNYTVYDVDTGTYDKKINDSCATVYDWATFKYINVTGYSGGNDIFMYLDDITINTLESEEGEGEAETLEDYDYIGCPDCLTDMYAFRQLDDQYFEFGFFVPMTKTITALDLYVYDLYTTSNLNNYQLYINENNVGIPDAYIDNDYWSTGKASVLRWTGLSVSLDNEMPYFELKSSNKVNGYYWGYASQNDDCDGDSYKHVFSHNDVSMYGNGFDGISDVGNYEPCYIMYYEGDETPPDNDVNNTDEDSITLNGNGYAGLHPTYDIETFFQNTSVLAHIEAYDLTYDRYIYFYDDDYNLVGQTQYVSPYVMENKYHDVIPFVPYNTGNYTVTVERNGVETANKTFYVYANTNDFQIWSVPSITQYNEQYQLHYIYSHGVRDGYLALFHNSDTNTFSDAFLTWDLGGNDVDGYITYTPTSFNLPQYWQLFSYNDGVYYPVGSQYRHMIKTSDDVEPYLYGSYDTIDLSTQQGRQRFHYGHDYLGADIWIFINGVKKVYVGDSQFSPLGGVEYYINQNGIYDCNLRVNINGTWFELSNTDYTFTVSGSSGGDDGGGGGIPNPDFDLFPEVSNTLGMIIGLIVTVFMTLSPFILAGSIGGNIQVPPVLYAVMGSLGVIVSTSFGWFPSYVLFFIIAVGIIVLALMYVMKMKGE